LGRFLAPAESAFQEAILIFAGHLTEDQRKRDIAKRATSMKELVEIITTTKLRYDNKHKDQKASKWLTKIATRVRFYGNIVDVLAQHHPEYVSLAWGAFKLLFVVRI